MQYNPLHVPAKMNENNRISEAYYARLVATPKNRESSYKLWLEAGREKIVNCHLN